MDIVEKMGFTEFDTIYKEGLTIIDLIHSTPTY